VALNRDSQTEGLRWKKEIDKEGWEGGERKTWPILSGNWAWGAKKAKQINDGGS